MFFFSLCKSISKIISLIYIVIIVVILIEHPTSMGFITKQLVSNQNRGYYLELTFPGTNQTINFLIDTGSSNTALPCAPIQDAAAFFDSEKSSSFHNAAIVAAMHYTSGSWEGLIGSDLIILSDTDQSIDDKKYIDPIRIDFTCIKKSNEFFIAGSGWSGILGLGYDRISSPDAASSETLMGTLSKSKYALNNFQIDLCGYASDSIYDDQSLKRGSITFGLNLTAIDYNSYFALDLYTVGFYEIVIYKIFVGSEELDLHCKELNSGKTIIDSGSHNIYLPDNVFFLLVEMIKSQVLTDVNSEFFSGSTDLCSEPAQQFSFESWPIVSLALIDGVNEDIVIEILPEQYIYPLASSSNLWDGQCYHFGISPSKNGDLILGEIFLEGISVIFDFEGKQLLFGNSTCPVWTENERGRFPMVQKVDLVNNSVEQCTIMKRPLFPGGSYRKLELFIFYGSCVGIFMASFAIGYMLCDIRRSRKSLENEEQFVILRPLNDDGLSNCGYGTAH